MDKRAPSVQGYPEYARRKFISLLATISLLLVSLDAVAQSSEVFSKSPGFALSLGPGLVTYLYSKEADLSAGKNLKTGYSGRLARRFELGERMYGNIGLSFDRKGVKRRYRVVYYDPIVEDEVVGVQETDVDDSYITACALAEYSVLKHRILVGAGCFAARLLKSKGTTTSVWDGSYYHSNLLRYSDKYDVGVCVSLTYRFRISEKHMLNIQAFEQLGMRNMVKSSMSGSSRRTISFCLLVGIEL